MTADTALSLDGTGRLDYSLKQGPKRDVLLRRALQGATSDPARPSSLEVKFRTRSKTGTLLHVQESSNYTTVKVREREEVNLRVINVCINRSLDEQIKVYEGSRIGKKGKKYIMIPWLAW